MARTAKPVEILLPFRKLPRGGTGHDLVDPEGQRAAHQGERQEEDNPCCRCRCRCRCTGGMRHLWEGVQVRGRFDDNNIYIDSLQQSPSKSLPSP